MYESNNSQRHPIFPLAKADGRLAEAAQHPYYYYLVHLFASLVLPF